MASYHWDFCHKYGLEPTQRQSLSPFDEKLRVKHQSDFQPQQARQAVSLCYEQISTAKYDGERLRVAVNNLRIPLWGPPVLFLAWQDRRRLHRRFAVPWLRRRARGRMENPRDLSCLNRHR